MKYIFDTCAYYTYIFNGGVCDSCTSILSIFVITSRVLETATFECNVATVQMSMSITLPITSTFGMLSKVLYFCFIRYVGNSIQSGVEE